MKKIWGVMAALCFVFVLAACSSSEAEENNDGDTEGSEKEVVEAESNDELTIYIVRHGKTMLNTTDRVQGWSDAVLTPAGEEVVTQAGIGLKGIDFQNAYSSDSGRAIQTAEIIMEENETSSELDLNTDDVFVNLTSEHMKEI